MIARAIAVVLDSLDLDALPDPVPLQVRSRFDIEALGNALRLLHQGSTDQDVARAKRSMRWREAFVLQAFLAKRRLGNDALRAQSSTENPPELQAFLGGFPLL